MSERSKGRPALLERVMMAGREIGAATVFFHQAVAESGGLCSADHKYLDELVRIGPMTAGELADATGLTSGAVTGVIDRLEASGLARRERDPHDRRKVIVVPLVDKATCLFAPHFQGLVRDLDRLHAGMSDADLTLVADYLQRVSAILRAQTRALRASKHGSELEPAATT